MIEERLPPELLCHVFSMLALSSTTTTVTSTTSGGHGESVVAWWVVPRFVCRRWNELVVAEAGQDAVKAPRDFSAQVAGQGWLSVLEWARANSCPWHGATDYRAARGGHLAVLMWMHERNIPIDWDRCRTVAAAGGHQEAVKWLRSVGDPILEAAKRAEKDRRMNVVMLGRPAVGMDTSMIRL